MNAPPKYKVLLVEDSPLLGKTMKKILADSSLPVEYCGQAFDGIEGLSFAKRISPDIAILDIHMPGMDGLSLAEQLKKCFPNIKIIILTAHDDNPLMQRAIRIRVDDYLLKPFAGKDILAAIERVCTLCAVEETPHLREDQPSLVTMATAFIDAHLSETLSLDLVAKHIHVSPTYLSRLLKQSTGMPFAAYLISKRLTTAKRLLLSTDMAVSEIAAEVGYPNPNSFAKIFRKYSNESPSEYRQRGKRL